MEDTDFQCVQILALLPIYCFFCVFSYTLLLLVATLILVVVTKVLLYRAAKSKLYTCKLQGLHTAQCLWLLWRCLWRPPQPGFTGFSTSADLVEGEMRDGRKPGPRLPNDLMVTPSSCHHPVTHPWWHPPVFSLVSAFSSGAPGCRVTAANHCITADVFINTQLLHSGMQSQNKKLFCVKKICASYILVFLMT